MATACAGTGCVAPKRGDGRETQHGTRPPSLAIYALSRGRGVPQETRGAFEQVRNALQAARRDGSVNHLEETRIGLEGETRLCAEFRDAQTAKRFTERIRGMTKDVELLNLVEEPCVRP